MTTEPTFGKRQQLARYIDEVNRRAGNRPAPAAFVDLPGEDAANHHLSVNSLEIENTAEIAGYFRQRMLPTNGTVALCVHRVHQYSEAASKAQVPVTYSNESSRWEFVGSDGDRQAAYKYRPVGGTLKSPSHCGAEFARMFDEHTAAKFARRMTSSKFHLFRKP